MRIFRLFLFSLRQPGRCRQIQEGMIQMNKMTIRDVDLKGKRVVMRVDFNVPIKEGVIKDDTRIRGALPTIQYVLEQGASLVLMSHLGRPSGKGYEADYSLKPVAEYLGKMLARPWLLRPIAPRPVMPPRRCSRAKC